MVRCHAAEELRWIRRNLVYVAGLVEEAIARLEDAAVTTGDTWLKRQLQGLGDEKGGG